MRTSLPVVPLFLVFFAGPAGAEQDPIAAPVDLAEVDEEELSTGEPACSEGVHDEPFVPYDEDEEEEEDEESLENSWLRHGLPFPVAALTFGELRLGLTVAEAHTLLGPPGETEDAGVMEASGERYVRQMWESHGVELGFSGTDDALVVEAILLSNAWVGPLPGSLAWGQTEEEIEAATHHTFEDGYFSLEDYDHWRSLSLHTEEARLVRVTYGSMGE
jgi:hypothetical protein